MLYGCSAPRAQIAAIMTASCSVPVLVTGSAHPVLGCAWPACMQRCYISHVLCAAGSIQRLWSHCSTGRN